ncbi:MAG: 3-methyl-2-oxobutanoate hydroxymethyltransferase, partial [Actinobacteria bacterium]|nr:3-methyl-2-oxobutanoate hydroxymethyltransferase [Actinomycetota bacterium]
SPADGLRTLAGEPAPLGELLDGASGVVMLATAGAAAPAAATIGAACTVRGIMSVGLILGHRRDVTAAVSAMRPHTRVLMVTEDDHDVAEVLLALRA